jgi:Zn finger protein HypA/HybF involved in hydrogenase expression
MNEQDKKAAFAARPRDYEYSDAQRLEDYYAFLDAQARCEDCHEGYYNEIGDELVCPRCGYRKSVAFD